MPQQTIFTITDDNKEGKNTLTKLALDNLNTQ